MQLLQDDIESVKKSQSSKSLYNSHSILVGRIQ